MPPFPSFESTRRRLYERSPPTPRARRRCIYHVARRRDGCAPSRHAVCQADVRRAVFAVFAAEFMSRAIEPMRSHHAAVCCTMLNYAFSRHLRHADASRCEAAGRCRGILRLRAAICRCRCHAAPLRIRGRYFERTAPRHCADLFRPQLDTRGRDAADTFTPPPMRRAADDAAAMPFAADIRAAAASYAVYAAYRRCASCHVRHAPMPAISIRCEPPEFFCRRRSRTSADIFRF